MPPTDDLYHGSRPVPEDSPDQRRVRRLKNLMSTVSLIIFVPFMAVALFGTRLPAALRGYLDGALVVIAVPLLPASVLLIRAALRAYPEVARSWGIRLMLAGGGLALVGMLYMLVVSTYFPPVSHTGLSLGVAVGALGGIAVALLGCLLAMFEAVRDAVASARRARRG
jgi:hypothetical protein